MLNILNEEAAEQMKAHFGSILRIFTNIISELKNLKSAFYVLR